MKKTDCLIIGQGIAGILLAFQLIKKGQNIIIIDEDNPNTASHRAGAILNPINLNIGKPFPKQDEEFKIAFGLYREMEQFMNVSFTERINIVYVPQNASTKEEFSQKLFQSISKKEQELLGAVCHLKEDYKILPGVAHIRFEILKQHWKSYLAAHGNWVSELFDPLKLVIREDSVCYKNIQASKIIFCEGVRGTQNPFFPQQPFTRNLGTTALLEITGIPEQYGFHLNHKKLLPLGNQQFWWGSNYQWNFEKPLPDLKWLEESLIELRNFLKVDFKILEHYAAQRPTTAGQKSLLQQHPQYPQLYFFNGLGTRGFSRGPYLSETFIKKYFSSSGS